MLERFCTGCLPRGVLQQEQTLTEIGGYVCRPLSLEMRILLLEVKVYTCQHLPHLLKSVDCPLPVLAILVKVPQWWGFSHFSPYRNYTTQILLLLRLLKKFQLCVFMLKFLLDYLFTSEKCFKLISIKY